MTSRDINPMMQFNDRLENVRVTEIDVIDVSEWRIL